MTAIDKIRCDTFERASTSDSTVWSRLIGISKEAPGRRGLAADRHVVLFIAGLTVCGFALVSVLLFLTLK